MSQFWCCDQDTELLHGGIRTIQLTIGMHKLWEVKIITIAISPRTGKHMDKRI